jgi:hypothetical protein
VQRNSLNTSATLFSCFALVFLGASIGCDRHDRNQRTVVATNSQWRILAIGNLDVAGAGIGRNYVTFEVERLGVPYASGPLYNAGPHDDSFKREYQRIDWSSPSVLRFWRQPTNPGESFVVTVRNLTTSPIKWLTVDNVELFLVLSLPAQGSTTFSSLDWNDSALFIQGEFQDGRRIPRVDASKQPDWRSVEIVLRDGAATVSGR